MAKRKKKTSFQINIEYAVVLFFIKLLYILPYTIASEIGGLIGRLGYALDSRHRNITLTNLRKAFPDADQETLITIAKSAFENFGRSTAETIHTASRKPASINRIISKRITVEGKEYLENALKKGKGLIYLAGHFGNWELLGIILGKNDCPYNVIVRPLDNPKVDRLVTGMRGITGGNIMPKKNVLLDVLKRLKRGEGLGILTDQNTSRESGIFVDFFGTPAATNKGPAIIAMKSGATVLPTFLIREGKYRFRLMYGKEVVLHKSGDPERDIFINTEMFTNILESYIRKYPEQWFWMHQRWKTRPE